ncbi:Sds3-like-domain-containing protein [Cercophora scortea]|uniref:Sds3-like-domain-containing protein n=1 Tax=Cercophora scortea TaxID=314031 RepID=A0AAE0J5F9_9PEZI|nr:Sds3-like-domain-containing protein [Cercophora scortea]
MATGDTAPPLALSSSPPPLLDHSPSSLSSPLSDVEDKDADHEEMAMNIHNYSPGRRRTPERNGNQLGRGSDSGSDSDDESKLSEMDINDSEAETERLYDTPRKDSGTRDNLGTVGDVGSRQFVDRRDRPFERSPSKLQQQIQADLDAEHGASDNNSLSEGEEEDDDDDASIVSSEPELESAEQTHLQSPSPAKENLAVASSADCSLSQLTRQDSAESRKRKRPLLVEKPEPEQPRRKRTGSIVVPDFEFHGDDTVMIDEEGTSTNPQSGNHTGEEDNNEETTVKRTGDAAALLEQDTREPIRSEKAKRSNNRRRRSKSPQAISSQAAANALIETAMDVDGTVADQPTPRAEDGQNETADEEAEAAHRNEEELERKKAAWEELTAIEKQFSNFRERLYQERLDQLNQEEAMLTSDNPTHPEYLAMLQCISERRDERIRVSSNELQLRMAMLKRRAVAERAQIMSQFYQSVRESRERVLEELGQEWYDIQQERRRFANAVPDYGIRFPATKTQTIKQAVAYNKEVSVLSGFAKHIGFPAAPPIHGASEDQLESDLAAISSSLKSIRLGIQLACPLGGTLDQLVNSL